MTIFFKKKTALYLASTLALFLFSFQTVFSQANLAVQFESAPLFGEANFLPGQNISRWVKVTNNTSSEQRIAAEAIHYSGFPNPDNIPADDLSRALDFIISEPDGADIFGGAAGPKTLFDFYSAGETFLSFAPAQSSKTYDFKIDFPAAKANEWQGKTTNFDLLVGFEGAEGEQDGAFVVASSGGGGGGLPPGLTIQGESVQAVEIGETSVVIRWTTSYFSTSQVLYDFLPGQFDLGLGAPGFGYAYYKIGDDSGLEKVTAHNITLTGLTPGAVYYYRTVSYASPATISREYFFKTSSSATTLKQEPTSSPPAKSIEDSEKNKEPAKQTPGAPSISQSGEKNKSVTALASEKEAKTQDTVQAAQKIAAPPAESLKILGIETEKTEKDLLDHLWASKYSVWLVWLLVIILFFIVFKKLKKKPSS